MSVNSGKVFLKEVSTGHSVEAELRDAIEAAQLADWQSSWLPARQQRIDALKLANAPASAFPQSAHWNWADKVGQMQHLLANQGYCIFCNGHTQAMMRLDLAGKRSRLPSQKNLDLVYIDYLETAPWNWEGPYWDPPLYRRSGLHLLRAAMEVSLAEGFKGRVGLHSLPQSVAFYSKCGLSALGADPGYPGYPLPYFEATPDQTKSFLT